MIAVSMSRQDFTAVAHCLREQLRGYRGFDQGEYAVEEVIAALADTFAGRYPNFDRERFLAAVRS